MKRFEAICVFVSMFYFECATAEIKPGFNSVLIHFNF